MADYNLSAELRRYCLALEMLRHGARPITVRHWTGFTYARTRQIVRIYNKNRTPTEPRCAHGPPPVGLKKLLRDTQLRVELTAVAGLCRVLKVLPDRGQPVASAQLRNPEMGESCATHTRSIGGWFPTASSHSNNSSCWWWPWRPMSAGRWSGARPVIPTC